MITHAGVHITFALVTRAHPHRCLCSHTLTHPAPSREPSVQKSTAHITRLSPPETPRLLRRTTWVPETFTSQNIYNIIDKVVQGIEIRTTCILHDRVTEAGLLGKENSSQVLKSVMET